jgi:hypothetical protein
MSGRSDAAAIASGERVRRAFATAVLASLSACVACSTGTDTIRLLEKPDAGPRVPSCQSDADCHGDNPRCEPDEHRCVECVSAAECAQGMACSSTMYTCEANCTTNADCNGLDQKVCNADGACVQCASDNDCAGTATLRCNTQGGVCVQCLTQADCSPRACFDDCLTCANNKCIRLL